MSGGWHEPPKKPRRETSSPFSKTSEFSRDILDFSKRSKMEVAQCYLIELKALSDIIVYSENSRFENRGMRPGSHNSEAPWAAGHHTLLS